MYSFHHRGDTEVIDEPFYAYYLQRTGIDHPGREEILQSQSVDFGTVVETISREVPEGKHRFIKDMAHHLLDPDWSFMKSFINIFLIRDPRQLIASFAQVIPNPTMRDIGVRQQYHMYEQMIEWGRPCLVVDSGDLLKDPTKYLMTLCDHLSIPFKAAMVSWPAGAVEADGVWAKYWYKALHQSTGLRPQSSSKRPLPSKCEALYAESLPYYEELSKYALRI